MSDFLVGSLVAIVSAIIGGILSLYISRRIVRESEFIKVCTIFRSEFADMLWFLEKEIKETENCIGEFFRLFQSSISKHNAAAIKFSAFLNHRDRKQFLLAYEDYCNPEYHKDTGIRGYLHYAADNSVEEKLIRDEVKNKVYILFSFADIQSSHKTDNIIKDFFKIFHVDTSN